MSTISTASTHEHPSNKATPRYYSEFRDLVIRGVIPVCREISMEMNRIDALIDSPEYFFDPGPVEGFITFCESELTKTDGSNVELLDTFKLWAEQLFGWYYYTIKKVWVDTPGRRGSGRFEDILVLKRLIKKQYLIVARGAAKSMYASFIQAYFLVIDGETTTQIATAPTMKQAEEILGPIRVAMTRAPGPLFKFLTSDIMTKRTGRNRYDRMLASTKRGIESHITGSLLEVRPMTIAKLQGLRPKVSTVDEWLSVDNVREDVVGAIEQGASKLDDYIIVATSSEGTVRNGSGDDIKLELAKILSGEYFDPHTSIFHYKLDDVLEVGIPDMWIKAQPNLGKTVSYETYERDVMRSEQSPSTRNDILAKRFGLPMEGYTYFFTYEETIPHRYRSYNDMECVLGADLSQGDDFCSFAFLFPLSGGLFGLKTVSYITERTLKGLPASARTKYELFIQEESLYVLPGSILDMTVVFQALHDVISIRGYGVYALGFDPYNAEVFVKLYKEHFGAFGVEVVKQGSKTETVPLGEIKKLTEDRMLIFDESMYQFAMGNAMVLVDTNGNRKLYKRRYPDKIDPVSATMDAWVAYTRAPR